MLGLVVKGGCNASVMRTPHLNKVLFSPIIERLFLSKISVLRLELFKHSHDSFLAALDAKEIPHNTIHQFSTAPQSSTLVESISALSEAMPWNSITRVMIAWIEARKSREIIITTNNGQTIHLKGYSISDAEKVIKSAINASVIDTKSSNET